MRTLTIVVTTKNQFQLTRLCIESIIWSLQPGSYEIIIVDDGSTDDTLQLKKYFRFYQTSVGGLYEAWNIGVQSAETEYVAILNNDLFFCTHNWWPRLKVVFESSNAGWLYPLTIETQSIVPDLYSIVEQAEADETIGFESRYGDIEACSFFIRKSLFDKVGPFDARFKIWYGEKDYEIRMAMHKIPYGRVNNVVVRHFSSSTIGLGARGDFVPQAPTAHQELMKMRCLSDRQLFCAKYSDESLGQLGLRIPNFGPGALRA